MGHQILSDWIVDIIIGFIIWALVQYVLGTRFVCKLVTELVSPIQGNEIYLLIIWSKSDRRR